MPILFFVLVFALLGAPVFAVMAGTTELAWLLHPNENLRFVRFLAPDVLDDRFAGSPILVTVPLFTFVGYLMAESKTPHRLVRASTAFFGWLPGGLAKSFSSAAAFNMSILRRATLATDCQPPRVLPVSANALVLSSLKLSIIKYYALRIE